MSAARLAELHSGSRWTPPPWEVWPEVRARSGRRVHPVVARQRPLLFAVTRGDADMAAAAPDLYAAVLQLLQCFDVREEGTFYVVEGDRAVIIPRHLRPVVRSALAALAKARGQARW
jgi:hypothetical protein